MFNIALSWAFLFSSRLDRAVTYAVTVAGVSAGHTAQLPLMIFAVQLATLGLLATVIYFVMVGSRLGRWLKPNREIHILLGIANVVTLLMLALTALSVWGYAGPASGILLVGVLTIGGVVGVLCSLVFLGGNIWLLVRSISSKEVEPPTPAWVPGEPAKNARVLSIVTLVVPLLLLAGVYYVRSLSLAKEASELQAKNARFEEQCKSVRIDIYQNVTNVKSVLFRTRSDVMFGLLDHLDFIEYKRDTWKEGEEPYVRLVKKPGVKDAPDGSANTVATDIKVPEATIEIGSRIVSGANNEKTDFFIEETLILDTQTGKNIALFSRADSGRARPETANYYCPREFDRKSFRQQAILFSLGLLDPITSAQFSERLRKFREGRSAQPQPVQSQ